MLGSKSCFLAILLACILAARAKIVHINGTEISGEDKKITAIVTPPVRYRVFNPQIINNHSGNKTKIEELSLNRRKDAEEEKQSATMEENSSNGTVAIRDTTVLTNLRGVFRDIKPTITVLSTILGLFFTFVLIQSPLSPLSVPPLPYPPIGPFPPTNIYPFGVPPSGKHYGVRYAGPPRHDGYRIPRHMDMLNDTVELEKLLGEVMDRVVPEALNDIIDPNKELLIHNVAVGMKSALASFGLYMDRSRNFLQDLINVHQNDLKRES